MTDSREATFHELLERLSRRRLPYVGRATPRIHATWGSGLMIVLDASVAAVLLNLNADATPIRQGIGRPA